MATKLFLVSLLLLQVVIAFGKGHHPPGVGHHPPGSGGHRKRGGPPKAAPAVVLPSQEPGGPAGGIPAETSQEPGGPAGGIPAEQAPGAAAGGAPVVTGKKWCIAKHGKLTAPLIADFQRLCKLIDCSATAPGGMCYDESHTSKATFAMNSYYQQHGQKDSDCVHDGRGEIVTSDPSWGVCKLIAN